MLVGKEKHPSTLKAACWGPRQEGGIRAMPLTRFRMSLFAAALGVAAAFYPAGAQEPRFVPVTDAVLQNPDPADWLRDRKSVV